MLEEKLMTGTKNILQRLKILCLILKRMSIKAWGGGKNNQGLILVAVVSVVLYFRLIDLWKAGMPYLYYTDEWHLLQPVIYFLTNQTLDLGAYFGQGSIIAEMLYCGGYKYALTYLGFLIHPFLRFFGIVVELNDYTDFYYWIVFFARVANLGFLSIAFLYIYRSAKLLRLPLAGLLAILQVSVSYPVLRMAGFAKAECFTMMLVAISFYFFLKFWKRGYSQTDYWCTIIFASLAFCAKLSAFPYVASITLLSTFLVLRRGSIRSSLMIIGIGFLLAITAFVVFNPYTLVYGWDMVVRAFPRTGDYLNHWGAGTLSISHIPSIMAHFSDFFSSYKLLIITLAISLYFLFTTNRILSMLFGFVVVFTCILFRGLFLSSIFSYHSVPVYSVISLCMWYFLLQGIRIGKSFLERESKRFKFVTMPLSIGLGLLLIAYLFGYTFRDAEAFHKFPYSYYIEHYNYRYDSIKWLDGRLPLGARIVFGSRSPKPNPYLYNTYNPFNMRYNYEKYQELFSRYDYVFTGYCPTAAHAPAFVRDAQIKMPGELFQQQYNEFFFTGNANGSNTPYSKIAECWIQHYSEEQPKLHIDWRDFLGDSLIKNGLFQAWDMDQAMYPNNFKRGGGTFLIERSQESHDDNRSPIRLEGKRFIFTQAIQDYGNLRGQYVTLFVQMKTSIPNKFGVKIYDGKQALFVTHPGTGRYEEITVSQKIDRQADRVVAYIVAARDMGSEEDAVEVKAAIMLPGKWNSLEDYHHYYKEAQEKSESFWAPYINVKPYSVMHWTIDWTKVNLREETIPNQYFTYIPLSRIPSLLTARHLNLIWPPDFRPSPDDEVVIEFQNINGIVLRHKQIRIAENISGNILTISEKLPFYETNIWGTNISNIKIVYKTIGQKNRVFFPHVEL